MYIQELEEGSGIDEPASAVADCGGIGAFDPKRAMVGLGARFLFYPTLLYNVLRNRIQVEFRWWDEVDQFLLLGAVPFPGDVPHLKNLGVGGVVTLNEPYETLVPTSLYHAYGIEHLVLPTRDYLFAPSYGDICRAVDFIYENVSCGKTTYVHCKAGRGRSTTIVLCYLVRYRQMTPTAAYEYVRLNRPRVLLASSQWKVPSNEKDRNALASYFQTLWTIIFIVNPLTSIVCQAVQTFYRFEAEKGCSTKCLGKSISTTSALIATNLNLTALEDSSYVMVSKSDLDGYDGSSSLWVELSSVYRMQFASQAAFAKFSCLRLRSHNNNQQRGIESCSLEADQGMMGHPCLVSGVAVKL